MQRINDPTIILFVIIAVMPELGSIKLEGMLENPFAIATRIMSIPEKTENILMKPEGVGLPNDPIALSKSKARMMKAMPRMLKARATASLVSPKTVAIPVATNNAPGTPKRIWNILDHTPAFLHICLEPRMNTPHSCYA